MGFMTLETGEINSFKDFGLINELIKAIEEVGYEMPSPIQIKTIPVLLEGRDIVGQAQTGTGKTAAFALPGLQKIDTSTSRIQLLVLTPTRELAIQVAEAFHTYAKHLGRIRVLPVYGGQSISQQIKHLRGGVQVIVGTPGRVMDHMRRETISLDNLKMVVLDEADEMLRMGFQEDVEWILSHTPETRQTALFSATMPRQVRRIADKYLNDPVNIETERKTMTVPTISQFYVNVSEGQKTDALTRILETDSSPGEAVLIFHRTKIGADQLTEKLQARGYAAEAMHGDMSQNQREAVIKKLKNGQVEIVVATDVAARGLDVEQITTVVNYDMPGDTEVYVHRIGRTGRAGREGKAILFVTPRQQRMKRDIENYTKQHIEPFRMPTQADVASRRVAILKERILDILAKQDLELYLSLVEELAEECGCDIAEIAAAATFLAVGDKPLEVKVQPPAEQLVKQWNTEMTRLFIDVGRRDGVSASHIVGAIANEADIPGKAIGAIDIYDRFTLVDVPSEFTERVLEQMRNSRIRSQKANVRVADSGDAPDKTRQTFEKSGSTFEKPRRSFEDKRAGFADKSGGDKSGGDKPPRRKQADSRENPFRKYEKPGRQKTTASRPKFESKTAKPKKLKDGKKKPKWTKEQHAQRNKSLK
jgi:ATP-dependent RNA helicase DeaD